jgi:hypothetical protein
MGPFDVTLFPFQELQQEELCGGEMGAVMNPYGYSKRVRHAAQLKTRYLIPASCSIKYIQAEWRNKRAFPVSRAEFKRDVQLLNSTMKLVDAKAGDSFELNKELIKIKSPSYARVSDSKDIDYEFQPNMIVPPLEEGYPELTDKKRLQSALMRLEADFLQICTEAATIDRFKELFAAEPMVVIEVVGAASAPVRFFYQFDKKGATACAKTNYHIKIKVHAYILARNLLDGAPYVALLDGIYVTGHVCDLKKKKAIYMHVQNNPLIFYFCKTAMNLDRKKVIQELAFII